MKMFMQETIYLFIKVWTYVMNLDAYNSFGTHWIALHMNGNNIVYFNCFGAGYSPKEI